MCEAPCPASGGYVSGERLSGDCGTDDNGSGAGGGVKRDGGDYNSGPWEELAPMNVKSTGIEQRPSSTFVMQGETGAQSNPMAGESGIGEASIPDNLHESNLLEWVEALELSNDPLDLPPFDIVLFPDLLVRAWEWGRLVPYGPADVKWSKYKKYLKLYFKKNPQKIAALCGNQQPESMDDGIATEFLNATADECVKIEKKLLRTCLHELTSQDIILVKLIMMHIGRIVRSEGGFLVKVVGLMCIMKEAKLMCLSRECNFEIMEIMTISNKVRQSALNLLLNYKGKESDVVAATAAMVGLVVEAEYLSDLLIQRAHGTLVKYLTSRIIRQHTAKVLTMLEDEFNCGVAYNAVVRGTLSNKSGKLKGVNAFSGTKCEEYDSTENSRKDINYENDNSTDGEKKRESTLNNQAERKLSKRKLKKQRVNTVDMTSEKDSIELSEKDINEQNSLNNQAEEGIGKVEAEGEEVGEDRRELAKWKLKEKKLERIGGNWQSGS
ncbi:unnamed protein product [Urochloa humidicola]